MADFVEAAKPDQLAPGHAMTVTVRGMPVALFDMEGTVYAIDDTCRHAGASLGTEELRDHIVRCRAHGWRSDVTTGYTLHDPEDRVTRYPVQVVDGTILVDVTWPSQVRADGRPDLLSPP
jgi:nitrite reductase/ring-hydroxylating ferredoxin subunit